MYSVLNCHKVAKHSEFTWDNYGSMWLSLVLHGVSKRALKWYSKYYCVASVTETFTLKGIQIIHPSTPFLHDGQVAIECKLLHFRYWQSNHILIWYFISYFINRVWYPKDKIMQMSWDPWLSHGNAILTDWVIINIKTDGNMFKNAQ
jgi:hypothetical protein